VGKKGINALEIVFAMFILIVVTLVVIRLFTSTVSKDVLPPLDDFKAAYNYDREKSKCDNLCSSFTSNGCSDLVAAVSFCQQKVFLDIDGNYRVGEKGHGGIIAGVPYCEDGLYCFHISTCGCGSFILTPEQCLVVMKDYYINQLGLSEKEAKQAIINQIKQGTCNPNPEMWGKRFYQGYVPIKPENCTVYNQPDGCNLPADWWWWKAGYGQIAKELGVVTAGMISFSFVCVRENENIKCNWFGCPLTGEVLIFLSDGSFYKDENKPAGSYSFGPMQPGAYSAILMCGGKTAEFGPIVI